MPNLILSQTSVQAGDTIANTSSFATFASMHLVPANKISSGSVVRVYGCFVLNTKLDPCGKLRLQLVAGTNQDVLCSINGTFGYYMQFDTHNLPVYFDALITCNSEGNLECDGTFVDINAGGLGSETFYFTSPVTRPIPYDAGIAQLWGVKAAFDTAHPDNHITMRQFVIEVIS